MLDNLVFLLYVHNVFRLGIVMSIPFFSYIYIGILCSIFIFSSSLKRAYVSNVAILFFIEIVYNQGYFIKLGNSEFTLQFIQYLIVFLFSIVYFFLKYTNNNKIVISLVIFFMMPLLSILGQFIFPYEGNILPTFSGMASWDQYMLGIASMCKYEFESATYMINYLKIIVYGMIIFVMKMVLIPADIYTLLTQINKWSIVVVIYGYIEMAMKNLFSMPQEVYMLTEFFFGVSKATYSWENVVMMEDGWYKLQGFTREPSHYVMSLFIFSLLILITIKYQKSKNIITPKCYYIELVLTSIILPMTGGMSAIWCIVSLIFIYMLLQMDRTVSLHSIVIKVFVLITVIGTLFICIQCLLNSSDAILIERFSQSLDTASILVSSPNVGLLTGMDLSTLSRFTSVITCLNIWSDNLLLGLGYGVMDAYDFTASMLVSTGLLGCASWYHYLTSCFYGKNKYDHLLLLPLMILIFLPVGPYGGWYIFFYFFLIVESTALYMH